MRKIILLILIVLSLSGCTSNGLVGARTDGYWNDFGTYLKTTATNGYNILINGANKYLNFNTISGSAGYGLRDNSGTIQYKNSGGVWADLGSGSGSATTTWGTILGNLSDQTDLQNVLDSKLSTTTALATYYLSTNPSGYIDSSALIPYLSTTTAALTYQPIGSYLTSESDPIYSSSSWFSTSNNAINWNTAYSWGNHATAGYLSTTTAANTYYPLTNPSNYITSSALTPYLSTTTAASTYTPLNRVLTINGTSYDLSTDRTWNITSGTSGYTANVYLTSATSTTNSSYYQLSYLNEDTTTTQSVTVNNAETLIKTYIYDNDLGVTAIDAGEWLFNFYSKVSSSAGNSTLKFEVFKRTSSGTETTLFSKYSNTISNTSYQRLEELSTTQGQFIVNSTDRLGIRVYGKNTVAASITISYQLGDDTSSWFNTPLKIRHNQLRDLSWNTSGHTGTTLNLASFDASGNANYTPISTFLSTTTGNWLGTWQSKNSTDFLASSTLYQVPLVSGTNIKTINGSTILGSGDLTVSGMVYPGAGIPNSTGSSWGTSYGTSGSGNIALTTSPSFTTPSLGVADATSINGVYMNEIDSNYNVFVGKEAGLNLQTPYISATYNTFLGYQTGKSDSVAQYYNSSYNTAIGYQSFFSNREGNENTSVGAGSLYSNITGNYNTAVGKNALFSNLDGINNVAIGDNALLSNTSSGNIALGNNTLFSNTTGNNNTAIGGFSLNGNISGSLNVALGNQAGMVIADGETSRTTGSNGLYLGSLSKASADGTTNEIVIGYNAIGAGSNKAVIGNSDITSVYFGSASSLASVYANSFIKTGGTSSQFLKADGSVDSTNYNQSTSTIGTLIHESTATTTPADSDEFSIWGSITSSLQKITWANLKSAILNYISSITATFTNKRITPRTGSIATTTALTINSDSYDSYYITGLEATTTINVSGTPTEGQKLILGITASTTAQGLLFATSTGGFATSSDLNLPSTTVANKTMYLGFIWNSIKSKWILMALLNNI